MIKIEEGKSYRARNGDKFSNATKSTKWPDRPWALLDEEGNSWTYRDRGQYYTEDIPSSHDLIAEWTDEPAPAAEPEADEQLPLIISYRNWRGEVSTRRLLPIDFRYGCNEWHPKPQWLLRAFDLDKRGEREFALADFNADEPAAEVATEVAHRIVESEKREETDELATAQARIAELERENARLRDAARMIGNGIESIRAERQRQTPDHDDHHQKGELTAAAFCYLQMALCQLADPPPSISLYPTAKWPWEPQRWTPSVVPERNLERAGALIAAELDCIARAALAQGEDR